MSSILRQFIIKYNIMIVEIMGKRIRELRKERNITQDEFAKNFNTTQDTVSLWERGLRAPNVEVIYKLSQFFDVSVDYLFGGDE